MGSEMCIRDSCRTLFPAVNGLLKKHPECGRNNHQSESKQTKPNSPDENCRSGDDNNNSSEKKVSWKDEGESNSKGTNWSGFARGVNGFCQAVPDETMQHTVSLYQKSETFNLKDVLMLDSGSTIKGTFCNPDFVCNLLEAETPMIMSTNGGEVFLNKEGDVPGYGACYVDPKQMANIFGLFAMSKHCLLYTSPSPRDLSTSRMPSSA